MQDEAWPPPPTHQLQTGITDVKPRLSFIPLILAAGFGLSLGIIDIHLTAKEDRYDLIDISYMAGAGLFGFLQPKTFWLTAVILTFCLYFVHVVAILDGVSALYVEQDTDHALYCLLNIFPNFTCALVGVAAKFVWNGRSFIFRKR